MNLLDYKHIIWDWNGTLFNDAWLCVEVMNTLLDRRGLSRMSHARYQEIFDFPVRAYYQRLGFDFQKESFEALGTEFMDIYNRRRFECALHADAQAALQAFRRSGRSQSILSAYQQSNLEEIVSHCGVRDYFVKLIGLDDHYARGKAHLGRAWVLELGCPPEEILLIGDTVHDFEVASEMGAHCLLIPGGNHTREKLTRCGVPVLDSLGEFLHLLTTNPTPA